MKKDETRDESLLSEREERALEAYHDCECGAFGKWRVRRLLAAKPAASTYIRALASTAEEIAAGRSEPGKGIDLWEKIDIRLEQEERAALFLGQRRTDESQQTWKMQWVWRVSWGLSGALVSAAVVAVAFLQFYPHDQNTQTPQAGASTIVPVAAAAGSLQYSPVALEPSLNNQAGVGNSGEESREFIPQPQLGRVPRVMEVDWMRSRGRVRMIQNTGEKTAILWIDRARQNQAVVSQRPVEGLAITPVVQSREPIRMLEDDVPRAFTAYDR